MLPLGQRIRTSLAGEERELYATRAGDALVLQVYKPKGIVPILVTSRRGDGTTHHRVTGGFDHPSLHVRAELGLLLDSFEGGV